MRIRTIKPSFWRSDDITALPMDMRVLFIGLWSYVDDNGVGLDDYRQIAADLFALEEDQNAIRVYVREGLATLSRGLLVVRYKIDDKSYLFIPTWDLHQKIDRPGKPRYPRPPQDIDPLASTNGQSVDQVAQVSRESRESLAPVVGEVEEEGRRGEGGTSSPAQADDQRSAQARGDTAPAGAAPPRTRGTRIPDDFTVTPAMVAWAREHTPHVDGRLETEKFIDYWQAKAGRDATKIDWVKTWRNWMRNAEERAPRTPRGVQANGLSIGTAGQRCANLQQFKGRFTDDGRLTDSVDGNTPVLRVISEGA